MNIKKLELEDVVDVSAGDTLCGADEIICVSTDGHYCCDPAAVEIPPDGRG